MADGTPVLAVERLSRSFGAIRALIEVSMAVHGGEIVGLVGDNGAGKSTLVKVVSGVYPPTSGRILIDGEEVELASPADSRRLGIETIHQHLGLVNQLDASANFYLGRELLGGGWIGWLLGHLRQREMQDAAQKAIEELHIRIPGMRRAPVERMSGGQRQAIAIARGVVFGRKMLLLDEPTAALGVEETAEVKRLMAMLAERDVPMIMISHNLQDVFEVCHRIVVLRLGRLVADFAKDDTTPEEVVGYITGALQPAA
jgi:ABC-type sugar transport system ATPase subunit